MRYVHELINGEHIWNYSGGEQTNKFFKNLDYTVKNKENMIAHYVLGATWDGDDQTERFIQNGIWENGYDDKFADIVNSVNVGDKVAIKSSYATKDRKSILRIKAIGTVTNNPKNGKILKVEWEKNFSSFDLENYGSYRNTIQIVANKDVKAIFNHSSEMSENKEISQINMSLNQILFGPPGTGKTFNSISEAVRIASSDRYTTNHTENKKIFDELCKEGQIDFVTFHQNYSYEDFMIGIRPNVSDAAINNLSFKKHYGVFYEIAKRARENYFFTLHATNNIENALFQIKQKVDKNRKYKIKMKTSFFNIAEINNENIVGYNQGGRYFTFQTNQILKDAVILNF